MSAITHKWNSISELEKAYEEGTTVRDVTKQYLDTIERLNDELNAVTVVNEKALEEAEKLDVRKHSYLNTASTNIANQALPRPSQNPNEVPSTASQS